MRGASFLALLIALAGCAGGAEQSSPSPAGTAATAATNAPADKSKVICRNQAETGSRLGSQRVCMTAEQWDRQTQDGKDVVREGAKIKNPSG